MYFENIIADYETSNILVLKDDHRKFSSSCENPNPFESSTKSLSFKDLSALKCQYFGLEISTSFERSAVPESID